MSMENVYLYGRPAGRPLTEASPHAAHTTKGMLRGRMSDELLAAHRAGRVEVAIGRASDYFGPRGGAQSNLGDRLFRPALAGRTATVLGDPDQPHTYSFVPDIGEGLVVLGEHPDAVGEVWHLPNDPDTRSTRQLVDMVYRLAGQPRTRLRSLPPAVLRLVGAVNPTVREWSRCGTCSKRRSWWTAARSPIGSGSAPLRWSRPSASLLTATGSPEPAAGIFSLLGS